MSGARRALVVGIDAYPDSPLNGCVNDADAIADLLANNADGSPNFFVRKLTGPPEDVTRQLLRRHVSELFSQPGEMSLFYFAGHGSENNLGGHLVTADATRFDEGVPMGDIITAANQQQHTEAAIIIDCCHAGHLGTSPAGSNQAVELREGVSILTAARRTQTAAETGGRGLFTSLICDALEGGAADALGDVTAAGVYAYADALLDPWGQRPLYKSHVASLSPLRRAASSVAVASVRRLPNWFATATSEYRLSRRHEHTEEGFDPALNAVFAALQGMRAARLVEPVDFAHMYDAAIAGGTCRLTPLGRRYWHLAKANRL